MQRPARSIQQSSTVSFRYATYSDLMSRTAGHRTGPQTLQSCLETWEQRLRGEIRIFPSRPWCVTRLLAPLETEANAEQMQLSSCRDLGPGCVPSWRGVPCLGRAGKGVAAEYLKCILPVLTQQ